MKRLLLSILLTAVTVAALAIPPRPVPPRLVNDLARIFTPAETSQLEATLSDFARSTSNQIAVVTVNDFEGEDKAQYAYQIGQHWGVGSKDFNNGGVILIKPKTTTSGEVFIATGYGLEGALPDAICKRIIEERMIPHFRQNDYYGGVKAALEVMIPIIKGEYDYPTGGDGMEGGIALIGILFFIILLVLIFGRSRHGGHDDGSGGRGGDRAKDIATGAILGSILGSRGRNGGSSSRGGGFGGFGGGGFGGGGAGGKW